MVDLQQSYEIGTLQKLTFFQHLRFLLQQLLLGVEILHLLNADALVLAGPLVEGIAAALHL